jgi:hypothetical protein
MKRYVLAALSLSCLATASAWAGGALRQSREEGLLAGH